MNLVELQRALRQLRLGGMAAVLEPRLLEAQSERVTPIDFISTLVSDELTRRSDRLLERRTKHAEFRDSDKTVDHILVFAVYVPRESTASLRKSADLR